MHFIDKDLATWPQIFSACHTSTHVDDCALRLHQRWSFHALCVLPLANTPFQRLLHRFGTVCWSQSDRLRRCKFSAADWKPNFLPGLTVMTNSFALTTFTWLHCLDLLLRVLVVLGLNATLKLIRPSSSSSSSNEASSVQTVETRHIRWKYRQTHCC